MASTRTTNDITVTALHSSVQLVGYRPSGRDPALLASDDGSIRSIPLEAGERLSYALGERHCAGVIDRHVGGSDESGGEGADETDAIHIPCDDPAAPYCEFHASTWVCARCTGTCLKDEMDCYEEHAVYIAAFAPDTFKVGVTKHRRLETRLREQGADRGAHIHTVSNGRIARELEAELARDPERGLTDRVRTGTKLESLAREVDADAWEALLEGFDVRERFTFDYGLDLPTQPVAETIASGTVVGIQGRLLVLERGGTRYGVDVRDLVGYELEPATEREGGGRRLQSSLGSFG